MTIETPKTFNDLAELILEIFEGLQFSYRKMPPGHRVYLEDFGPLEPFSPEWLPLMHLAQGSAAVEMGYFTNVEPRDIENDWDQSLLVTGTDSPGDLAIERCCSVPLSQLRGLKINGLYHARLQGAYIERKAEGYRAKESCRLLMEYANGRWKHLYRSAMPTDGRDGLIAVSGWGAAAEWVDDEEFDQRMQLFLGHAYTRHFEWVVTLGYTDGPRVLFVTDPLGSKEVFRLRDIPEGASRRAALRNWVRQHWRKNRSGLEASVREHLRGAVRFNWNGLYCEITPSAHDLIRNALNAERKWEHDEQIRAWARQRGLVNKLNEKGFFPRVDQ